MTSMANKMKKLAPLTVLVVVTAMSGSVWAGCTSVVPMTTPKTHFTFHRDGTVTDNTTGLMWTVCMLGQSLSDCSAGEEIRLSWASALYEVDLISSSGHLGYYDWRLPNAKELASILEASCTEPSMNPKVFPVAGAKNAWTSTPVLGDSNEIWVVNFAGAGQLAKVPVYTDEYGIRLVRSGADYQQDLRGKVEQ